MDAILQARIETTFDLLQDVTSAQTYAVRRRNGL
jgi:hypothetical protein